LKEKEEEEEEKKKRKRRKRKKSYVRENKFVRLGSSFQVLHNMILFIVASPCRTFIVAHHARPCHLSPPLPRRLLASSPP